MSSPPVRLEVVDQARTRSLRQAVLRPHQSLEELEAEERPDAICFVAIDSDTDEIISTATLLDEEMPFTPFEEVSGHHLPSWRLRSMATASAWRGEGVGRAVLEGVIEHIADTGGGMLWCAARTSAREFYERAGFVAYGQEWLEQHIGPHVYMWRLISLEHP